jgi:hypothetical protein
LCAFTAFIGFFFPVEEEDTEDHAANAEYHVQMRNHYLRQAALAYSIGSAALARDLNKMGHFHNRQFRESHLRHSMRAGGGHGGSYGGVGGDGLRRTLDLHGLLLKDALLSVEEWVAHVEEHLTRTNTPSCVVTIITGAGRHSINGVARLLPAVRQWLEDRRYRFKQVTDGAFSVEIHSHR